MLKILIRKVNADNLSSLIPSNVKTVVHLFSKLLLQNCKKVKFLNVLSYNKKIQ